MSLIFNWDARKGTLIDSVSKTAGTLIGTDIEFKKIEKGLSLRNENTSSLNTNISLSLGTGDNTIVFANKFKGDGNNGAFIAQYDNSNNGFDFAIRSNNHFEFYYRNTSVNLTPLLSATKYYGRTNLFIIIRKGTTVYTYINNELVSTKTGVTNDLTNNSNLFIGSRLSGNFVGKSDMLYTKIYNHALTSKERNNLYKEFLRSSPTEKPIKDFEYPKPTDLSSEVNSKVGENLIQSLDFTNWWQNYNSQTINNNTFTTNSNGSVYKTGIVEANKKYKLYIKGTTTASKVQLRSSNSQTTYIDELTGSFEKTIIITTNNNLGFTIANIGAGETTISNFTVQEVTGLVAAYNMIPSNGTLIDISGNGNNMTITDCPSTKDGLQSRGHNTNSMLKVNSLIFDLATVWSFQTRFKNYVGGTTFDNFIGSNHSERNIWLRVSNKISFRSGTGDYYYFDALYSDVENNEVDLQFVCDGTTVSLYIDGVLNSTVTPNSTEIYFLSILRGYSNNNFTPKLEILDFRAWNRPLTSQEAKDYHNSFIKPVIIEDFSNNAVGDTI